MSFNVEHTIASLERSEKLRDAEANGAWVIRKRKLVRVRSKTECEARSGDALTCLHGNSYTMTCAKCKRNKLEADTHLNLLKLMLSST